MFFTRKIGKFLRGKVTPLQLISATVLGALIAGSPGWAQAPLWNLLLFFALLILNANLFLAGITYLGVKLISLLLLPLYFHIGVSLVEGPLNGLVAAFANAPVSAWFGWEYYVTLPSLTVALLIGLGLGIFVSRLIRGMRHKLANLETGSERYQAYTSKWWVKVVAWIFLGGLKGKQSWEELAEMKKGRPVRISGLIVVAGLAVLLFIGLQLLDSRIVTAILRDELAQMNGATADLDGVTIDAAANQVTINGLALADPNNLAENRFAADALVADISGMQLLAKKMVIDRLEAVNAVSSVPRKIPGRIVGKPVEPEVDEEEPEDNVFSIDDYLEKGAVWRERLQTLHKVYQKISPHLGKDGEAEDEAEKGLTWRQRLEQEAALSGYASVKSDSVIRQSPQLVIREIIANDIEIGGNDQVLSLIGSNVSTQPHLLDAERGSLRLADAAESFLVNLILPNAASPLTTGIELAYKDLSVNELKDQTDGKLPLTGGTMSFRGTGEIISGQLDLPLEVTLNNTTMSAFGSEVPLNNLPVQVAVSGSLASPRVAIPTDAFQGMLKDAAIDAGKQKLQEELEDKAGDKIKDLFKGFGGGD